MTLLAITLGRQMSQLSMDRGRLQWGLGFLGPQKMPKFPVKVGKTLVSMTVGGTLVVALLGLVGFAWSGDRFMKGLMLMLIPPQPEPEVDVRSVVVQQIRGASELTTAVFAMEAVVPASRDRTLAGYTIAKTTLLYIAYGEVRAGVDLGEIQASNVRLVDEETLQITLPQPRILDKKIDVERSNVYDYDRGFLDLGPDTAPELQTLAQQETLQKIVEAACAEGILTEANQRAELVVGQLMNTAGYKAVRIETQPPKANACSS